MIIGCPSCGKRYRVDDERIAHQATALRCSACGHQFSLSTAVPPDPAATPAGGAREGVEPYGSTGPEKGTGGDACFSIGEAIRFGWSCVERKILFLIGAFLVAFIANVVPEAGAAVFKESSPVISLLFNLASIVVSAVTTMGFIKIFLKLYDNADVNLGDLFSCAHLLLKYLVFSIVYLLIVIGGMILLVVPGIIWGIMFMFGTYVIVASEAGPIEALRKSAAMTRGCKWRLFLLGLALLGINLAGLVALGIGLAATIPLSMGAVVFAFRRLEALHDPA